MTDKNEIMSAIANAGRIGIAGHIHPDGDCIGSCLGLYNYITANYSCRCDVYLEEIPQCFRCIAGCDVVNSSYPDAEPYDAFFALDCGDIDRLGKAEKYLKNAVLSFYIDHHCTNT